MTGWSRGTYVSDSETLSTNFPLRPQATCPSILKQPHELQCPHMRNPEKDNVKPQISTCRKESQDGKSP